MKSISSLARSCHLAIDHSNCSFNSAKEESGAAMGPAEGGRLFESVDHALDSVCWHYFSVSMRYPTLSCELRSTTPARAHSCSPSSLTQSVSQAELTAAAAVLTAERQHHTTALPTAWHWLRDWNESQSLCSVQCARTSAVLPPAPSCPASFPALLRCCGPCLLRDHFHPGNNCKFVT